MGERKVTVRVLGQPEAAVQRLAEALASLGSDVRVQRDDRPGPGASVLCFEAVSDELLRLVRRLSDDGHERVLAVAAETLDLDDAAAFALLQAGAADVLAWDQYPDLLAMVVERMKRWTSVEHLLHSELVGQALAGKSQSWLGVLRQVIEVARFTASSVLITGQSGTGKELVARLIHDLDARAGKGQLVVLDCTTVVPELSGSEFFGHERGAFTGAVASRDGAFALADGGTLFLDEVGELPLRLQAELLRVVQERTYKRVGSNDWRRANFRLVCATHRNLEQDRADGAFRDDFYHRLAGWSCHLPPLCERREDILPLCHHFLSQIYPDHPPPALDRRVADFLQTRSYPGNVRELRHIVMRLASRHVGPGPITIGALPEDELKKYCGKAQHWPDAAFDATIRDALARGKGLVDIRNAAVEAAYRAVLSSEDNDTARSAARLKVSQRAVQQHLQSKLAS